MHRATRGLSRGSQREETRGGTAEKGARCSPSDTFCLVHSHVATPVTWVDVGDRQCYRLSSPIFPLELWLRVSSKLRLSICGFSAQGEDSSEPVC